MQHGWGLKFLQAAHSLSPEKTNPTFAMLGLGRKLPPVAAPSRKRKAKHVKPLAAQDKTSLALKSCPSLGRAVLKWHPDATPVPCSSQLETLHDSA